MFLSVEHYHLPPNHAVQFFSVFFLDSAHWIKISGPLVFMFNPHNFHKDKTLMHAGGPVIMISLKTMRDSMGGSSNNVITGETEFSGIRHTVIPCLKEIKV